MVREERKTGRDIREGTRLGGQGRIKIAKATEGDIGRDGGVEGGRRGQIGRARQKERERARALEGGMEGER
jgi:hypothetical protein